jgi:SHS2 domain-containing protein
MELAVTAATLREAFAQAALAALGLAVDSTSLLDREVREVRAHGTTPETLLAQWIDECLYLCEVEGFGCRHIDFAVFDTEPKPGGEPLRLHAFLRGEQLDPTRHVLRAQIKPGPPRSVSVRSLPGRVEIALELPA